MVDTGPGFALPEGMEARVLRGAAFRAAPFLLLAFLAGAVLRPETFLPGDPGVAGWALAAGRLPSPARLPGVDPAPAATPVPEPAPPPAEGSTLSLRVFGPVEEEDWSWQGRPPAGGTEVTVLSEAGLLAIAVADGEGLVAIPGIPDVDLVIQARRPGEAGLLYLERGRGDGAFDLRLEPEVWISGLVTDVRDGSAIPEAEVFIQDCHYPEFYGLTGAAMVAGEDGGPPPYRAQLARGRTDATGRFRISAAKHRVDTGILVARAPSFAPAALEDLDPDEEVHLALDPAGSVRGRVLGADGAPVAGAEVLVLRGGGDLSGLSRNRFPEVEPLALLSLSRTDGSWRVDGVPAGRALTLFARKEGFADAPPTTDSWVPVPGAVVERDLVLLRSSRLVVQLDGVKTEEGRHLQVEAILSGDRESRRLNQIPGSGPASFVLEEVPPGPVHLRAYSVVHRSTCGVNRRDCVLAAGGGGVVWSGWDGTVTLGGVERVTLEGTLVDEDGLPVAGFGLMAQAVEDWRYWIRPDHVETDSAGGFRFTGLPDGEVRITVAYERRTLSVVVAPAEGVRISLRNRSSVEFFLVGSDGERTRGTTFVGWETADGFGSAKVSVDGAEGLWVAEDLPAGELFLRFASLAEGVAERRVLLRAGEKRDLGGLELRPWLRVRGRVVDGGGDPVAGATVAVLGAVVSPDDEDSLTDGEGGFEVGVDGEREVLLAIGAEGFADREWAVEAGGGDAGTLVLTRPGVAEVRVCAPDGRPLRCMVEFVPECSTDPEADAWADRADDRGRVRMDLSPGRWRVRIPGEGEDEPSRELGVVEVPEGGSVAAAFVNDK